MKNIIWCPMKSEARAVRAGVSSLGVSSSGTSVFATGIGRRKSLRWSAKFQAELEGMSAKSQAGEIEALYIVGYGGALDSSLKTGQIFIADEIMVRGNGGQKGGEGGNQEGDEPGNTGNVSRRKLPAGTTLAEKLGRQLDSGDFSVDIPADTQCGAVCSSRRPALLGKKRRELNDLGARVADMESWWLTEALSPELLAKTAVIRVVSDARFSHLLNPRKHLKVASQSLQQIGRILNGL